MDLFVRIVARRLPGSRVKDALNAVSAVAHAVLIPVSASNVKQPSSTPWMPPRSSASW